MPVDAGRLALSVARSRVCGMLRSGSAPLDASGFKEPGFGGARIRDRRLINSAPLTLKACGDELSLVDFWTFGCYNCRNTLPALKNWDARYRERLWSYNC